VPLLYTWADLIIEGGMGEEQVTDVRAPEGYRL
jgi:hypothetical protein